MKILRIVVIVVLVLIIIAILAVSCRNNKNDSPANTEQPQTTEVTDNQGVVGNTDAKQDDTPNINDTSVSGTSEDTTDVSASNDEPNQETPESGKITITGWEGTPTFIVLDTEDGSYLTVTPQGDTATTMVPVGFYHIFAYYPDYAYTAAWHESGGLAPINVSIDQAVAVTVKAPPDYCSALYQLPGTADGQYPATDSDAYKARHQCAVATSTTPEEEGGGAANVSLGGMPPTTVGEVALPPAGNPDMMGCIQPNVPQPTGSWYEVQTCDNLFRIGLAYGLSWTTIAYYNGLYNANYIVPGQWLFIPWQ